MRALLSAFTFAALAIPAAAGDPGKKEPARPLLLKLTTKAEPGAGGAKIKAVVSKAEDLDKTFTPEDSKAIVKEVDFAKEKVLYFSWSGSGQDKLSVGSYDAKANEVALVYKAGLTRDLRSHQFLFAVPKDAKWKVETQGGK